MNDLASRIYNRLCRYRLLRRPVIKSVEQLRNVVFNLNLPRKRKLVERYLQCSDFASLFQFSADVLCPHQKCSEIEQFIRFAAAKSPKIALEIGVAQAGTTFLLKENLPSLEQIIGIDVNLHNVFKLEAFNKRGCKLQFFEGSSRDEDILSAVKTSLAGDKLDLLFIDGDHSYSGVKSDFERYRHLVADGGLIAFHDICSDYQSRHNISTHTYAGDVPKFWQELKSCYDHREFVEDYDQDGFGIGCLEYRDQPLY
jgi:predicted O-methyltransferase YrrM